MPELKFCGSLPADEYRTDLHTQFVFCAHDDCDYDVGDCFIPFLDYVSLFQDEWARVNGR